MVKKIQKNNLTAIFLLNILFSILFLIPSIKNKLSALDLDLNSFNDFDISLSNPTPTPYEFLEAKITGANFDITKTNIKWILNNKTLSEGENESAVSFSLGNTGQEYKLTIIITNPQGFSATKTIILNPSDLDLLWSAETYTPYFYKGKSLAVVASKVIVSAVPNIVLEGKKIDAKNLYFKWFLNDDLSEEGWNKDSFAFNTGIFEKQKNEIKVLISNEKGGIIQNKTIIIPLSKPQINFYEYNNVYNEKTNKIISNFEITAGDKAVFVAEPYFIPNLNPNSLKYLWTLNGSEIELKEPYNILDFSTDSDFKGIAQINLSINFNDLIKEIKNKFIITIK